MRYMVCLSLSDRDSVVGQVIVRRQPTPHDGLHVEFRELSLAKIEGTLLLRKQKPNDLVW